MAVTFTIFLQFFVKKLLKIVKILGKDHLMVLKGPLSAKKLLKLRRCSLIVKFGKWNSTTLLKNVNNCLNTNVYSYSE